MGEVSHLRSVFSGVGGLMLSRSHCTPLALKQSSPRQVSRQGSPLHESSANAMASSAILLRGVITQRPPVVDVSPCRTVPPSTLAQSSVSSDELNCTGP